MIFAIIWTILLGAAWTYVVYAERRNVSLLWSLYGSVFVIFGIIVQVSMAWIGESYQTYDIERLGGHAYCVEHYEAWNERVPCRHPKYRTVTRVDSKGRTSTHRVFDGYQHMYDVDYHPERFELVTTLKKIDINNSDYVNLKNRWGNEIFVDMHRSYHTIDGDKYVSNWNQKMETLEPVFVTSRYENRIQASNSLFNFREVDPKKTPVYEYPKLNRWRSQNILGPHSTKDLNKQLELLNAVVGRNNQCHVWIVTWKNQPQSVGFDQKDFWKGGNKNELIISLSTDDENYVEWCYVFSWMDDQTFSYKIRDFMMDQGKVDLESLIQWLGDEIPSNWKRKEFSENAPDGGFSYVKVDPPLWSVIVAHTLTVVGGIAIFMFTFSSVFSNARNSLHRRRF